MLDFNSCRCTVPFSQCFIFSPHFIPGPQSTFQTWGPVSRNSRELFGPEKPVIKLQSTYFEKLILLTCFQNVRKTKRIAKFDDLEPRRCEDIKGIVAPEIGPKTFETFEKQATVPRFIPGPQSAVRSTSFY